MKYDDYLVDIANEVRDLKYQQEKEIKDLHEKIKYLTKLITEMNPEKSTKAASRVPKKKDK